MKIGLLMPFTGYTANPAAFARKAEQLGFESLWIPEHPILPVNPKTPFPGTNGPIPNVYSQMCDPFVALSMAAAVTTKLEVATGICLVPERNAIVTAKEVATLDAFLQRAFPVRHRRRMAARGIGTPRRRFSAALDADRRIHRRDARAVVEG